MWFRDDQISAVADVGAVHYCHRELPDVTGDLGTGRRGGRSALWIPLCEGVSVTLDSVHIYLCIMRRHALETFGHTIRRSLADVGSCGRNQLEFLSWPAGERLLRCSYTTSIQDICQIMSQRLHSVCMSETACKTCTCK
jgi:hypothetical protein